MVINMANVEGARPNIKKTAAKMRYPAAAIRRREKRSLNQPAGHDPRVYVILKTSPSRGASFTGMPTSCARITRNMSLEFPRENKLTAINTPKNEAGNALTDSTEAFSDFEAVGFAAGLSVERCLVSRIPNSATSTHSAPGIPAAQKTP